MEKYGIRERASGLEVYPPAFTMNEQSCELTRSAFNWVHARSMRILMGFACLACFGVVRAEPTGAPLDAPSKISIEDAVVLALKRNHTVRIGEVEVRKAEEAVATASEPFELTASLNAETFRSKQTGPSDYPYSVEGNRQTATLSKQFTTGTAVELSAESTAYDGVPGDDHYASVGVGLSQSLLRNRGFAANRAPIRVAQRRADFSREAFRQLLIDTLSDTHYAYFDAILAEENLRVAQESLALSRQLHEENRRRSQVGSIAPSDLLQAEAEVALREERVYQAEGDLVAARNRLKRMLSDQMEGLVEWDFSLASLPAPESRIMDLRGEYDVACRERPDYRQAVISLDIADIERIREENASLPALDLYARMSFNGQSSDIGGGLSDSFDDTSPNYAVGLKLSRSIRNGSADARAAMAGLERTRMRMTLSQLEQSILLDLDSAIARISSNWKRLESARNSRVLAERSLEAEQKRYQTGTSSTFVLIRLQTDLVNARIRELVTGNEYRKSLIELDRQTGRILSDWNIEM